MSGHPLQWTRRAVVRLDQIGDHIAKDDPNAAALWRVSCRRWTISQATSMECIGRIKRTREYVFADIPYNVAHRLKSQAIEIVTIIHGAQRWPLNLD